MRVRYPDGGYGMRTETACVQELCRIKGLKETFFHKISLPNLFKLVATRSLESLEMEMVTWFADDDHPEDMSTDEIISKIVAKSLNSGIKVTIWP